MPSSALYKQDKNNLYQRDALFKGRKREVKIEGYIASDERDIETIDSHFDSLCRSVNNTLIHPVDVNFEKQKGIPLQKLRISIKYYLVPN
jgi:hypothetical protein